MDVYFYIIKDVILPSVAGLISLLFFILRSQVMKNTESIALLAKEIEEKEDKINDKIMQIYEHINKKMDIMHDNLTEVKVNIGKIRGFIDTYSGSVSNND